MSNTGIPYLTKSWNFYTGCLHGLDKCPVANECWARDNYHRFKRDYTPTLHPEKLLEPLKWHKSERIGVCFTGDLFGDWVDPAQLIDVADNPLFGTNEKSGRKWPLNCIVSDVIFSTPHQYFFLTKNLAGYRKWGQFPDNAWCGVTVCNLMMYYKAMDALENIETKHKWLSFEPLMESMGIPGENFLKDISWVIIGGWSTVAQRKRHPINPDWIKEIIEACDKVNIPVFLKPNLLELLMSDTKSLVNDIFWRDEKSHLRQELPEAKE